MPLLHFEIIFDIHIKHKFKDFYVLIIFNIIWWMSKEKFVLTASELKYTINEENKDITQVKITLTIYKSPAL